MIKNTRIDGSLTVGRHLNAGGNFGISGSATVGHDLRVDGWLDAPNIKQCGKGLYRSADLLREAYPFPGHGWWALVGDTLPARLWVSEHGEWTDAGRDTGTPTLDAPSLSTLAQQIDDATERAYTAATAAERAAEEIGHLSETIADTAQEAIETADDARLIAGGAGVVPFDGFVAPGSMELHYKGVWFQLPGVGHPARFRFISSDYGLGITDYHDADAPEGESAVRRDCLFRYGNSLWRFNGHTLMSVADAPVEIASEADFKTLTAAGSADAGRFYCVVDPATRRVTQLYLA